MYKWTEVGEKEVEREGYAVRKAEWERDRGRDGWRGRGKTQ